jgi:hypothetical protein
VGEADGIRVAQLRRRLFAEPVNDHGYDGEEHHRYQHSQEKADVFGRHATMIIEVAAGLVFIRR